MPRVLSVKPLLEGRIEQSPIHGACSLLFQLTPVCTMKHALKECLIYAMLLANPVQNGSSDASDVQFWSEFW